MKSYTNNKVYTNELRKKRKKNTKLRLTIIFQGKKKNKSLEVR